MKPTSKEANPNNLVRLYVKQPYKVARHEFDLEGDKQKIYSTAMSKPEPNERAISFLRFSLVFSHPV